VGETQKPSLLNWGEGFLLALQIFHFEAKSGVAVRSPGVPPVKYASSRQSGQILWIAVIILCAMPVHAYTTPWMHPPEFDDGWGLLDPSTWSDPNEFERQTALTGGWGGLRRTLHDDGIDFTGL
jgi:hypothetical protein